MIHMNHTSSLSVRRGEGCKGLLEVINTVSLLLDVIELHTNGSAGRRDVFEGSSGWEVESFLQFFDKSVGVESVEQVNVSW